MPETLVPGSRWVSAVDDTEVIILKSDNPGLRLECGGQAMHPKGTERPDGLALKPTMAAGTMAGQYVSALGLRVLCVKAGIGTLSVNGVPMGPDEGVQVVPLGSRFVDP